MDIRDHSIDIAKGLGIFLVIWGHCFPGDTIGKLLYSFHMPLFFLLSGIFHKQQISFYQLIQSKSRSLLLPYVFFSLFSYLFYLIWALLLTGIDTFDFYSIFQLIPYKDAICVPLWFFISLFEVTIIYYLLKNSIQKSSVLLLITLSFSVFSYCISQLNLSYYYNYFHVFSSFSMLFFYALGCEMFKGFRARIVPNQMILKVIVFMMTFFLVIYVNTFSKGIDVNGNVFNVPFLIYILAAFMGIYGLWLISVTINNLNVVSDFWIFVGKNSMGIFAIHMPMFELARPLMKRVIIPGNTLSGFVVAILTLIIAIGVNEIFKIIFPYIYMDWKERVFGISKKKQFKLIN